MEKLEKYGVQEMNAVEMREVDGGAEKLPYAKYTFSGTNNPIRYTAEAIGNGLKLIYNGAAAAWNWAIS
jgi:hypothetical protein